MNRIISSTMEDSMPQYGLRIDFEEGTVATLGRKNPGDYAIISGISRDYMRLKYMPWAHINGVHYLKIGDYYLSVDGHKPLSFHALELIKCANMGIQINVKGRPSVYIPSQYWTIGETIDQLVQVEHDSSKTQYSNYLLAWMIQHERFSSLRDAPTPDSSYFVDIELLAQNPNMTQIDNLCPDGNFPSHGIYTDIFEYSVEPTIPLITDEISYIDTQCFAALI